MEKSSQSTGGSSKGFAPTAERSALIARTISERSGRGMVEDKTRTAKESLAPYTERFSGGIKVNLDAPDPIEICGRT
jgi:hypothetical protein